VIFVRAQEHTKEWKEKHFEELVGFLKKYSVVAVASPQGLPADSFQALREKLKQKNSVVKYAKTRIALKAIEKVSKERKGLEKLKPYIKGSVVFIFSEENPFSLYNFLERNKEKTVPKPGMVSPLDIVVPERDTGIPPGPALSDFKQIGLKTKIEKGTIHIAEKKLVVEKGKQVSSTVANILGKLGLKVVPVGLNIKAVFDGASIYLPEFLYVDLEKTKQDILNAFSAAVNLALQISYPLRETTHILLRKASSNAFVLAMEIAYETRETLPFLLGKAEAQALGLKEKAK